MIKLCSALSLASIIATASPIRAATQACDCQAAFSGDESAVRRLVGESDAVVLGRVEAISRDGNEDFVRARLAVELIYKGEGTPLGFEVRAPVGDGTCGFAAIKDLGTRILFLTRDDAGYSIDACRFLAVNYYEPSHSVVSTEHQDFVDALVRIAPPHEPVLPTPRPDVGDDQPGNSHAPPRIVWLPTLVGILALGLGFIAGRRTAF